MNVMSNEWQLEENMEQIGSYTMVEKVTVTVLEAVLEFSRNHL